MIYWWWHYFDIGLLTMYMTMKRSRFNSNSQKPCIIPNIHDLYANESNDLSLGILDNHLRMERKIFQWKYSCYRHAIFHKKWILKYMLRRQSKNTFSWEKKKMFHTPRFEPWSSCSDARNLASLININEALSISITKINYRN